LDKIENRICILTGPIQSGKSTFLKDIILSTDKRHISGFLTLRMPGFEKALWDIENDDHYPFFMDSIYENSVPIGRFFINKSTLEIGSEIICRFLLQSKDILIVDELGKLEIQDKGFHQAFKTMLEDISHHKSKKVLIVVRDYCLDQIIDKYKINPTFYTMGKGSDEIIKFLKN
jgi:nucleoside-triphosphatase THEP1